MNATTIYGMRSTPLPSARVLVDQLDIGITRLGDLAAQVKPGDPQARQHVAECHAQLVGLQRLTARLGEALEREASHP